MSADPRPSAPRTLLDKVWERHQVRLDGDGQSLLYVARHIVYDSSFHSFEFLRRRGLRIRRPDLTFSTSDHFVPTGGRDARAFADDETRTVVELLDRNARDFGFTHFGLDDPRQGIVHVVMPELGVALPGLVIVCADSHISTLGAFGTIPIGVGHSESYHVLATQTVWQAKPRMMRVVVTGRLPDGVSAKDLSLAVIARIGVGGAIGHVLEYTGSTIAALSMEQRMTLCNMAIECGARFGLVAPDETTFAYVAGRPHAPSGRDLETAVADWRELASDPGAAIDAEVVLDGAAVEPTVTWGITPGDALPVGGRVPDPARAPSAEARATIEKAIAYMGLTPGMALADIAIDRVFIGSCTNSRIEDLRAAAAIARRGRAVVPAMVVPGSSAVKRQAEAEGLDRIFKAAGYEWRESGCSMCVAVNGDMVAPGERCASTSNRNYMNRQGPGARTHLMSPAMAAAAALTGRITDVRRLLAGG